MLSRTGFKRGPDEEGIETDTCPSALSLRKFKRGPDEEGIETCPMADTIVPAMFKRKPDEEGIETYSASLYVPLPGSNADLMKKGLRPSDLHPTRGQCRSNADLMKKGLRPGLETPA